MCKYIRSVNQNIKLLGGPASKDAKRIEVNLFLLMALIQGLKRLIPASLHKRCKSVPYTYKESEMTVDPFENKFLRNILGHIIENV